MKKFTVPIAVPFAMVAGLMAPHALAADMPVKAPPMAAAPAGFSWNGCYVGVHAGYGWGKNTNQFGSVIDGGEADRSIENGDYSHNTSGGLGGVQYGCNTQWTNWVLGIENEWFFTGMKGSTTTPEDEQEAGGAGNLTRFESKNLYDTNLTVRLGYAYDRSLFYGKIGAAWARFEYDETHDDFPTNHACGPCTVTFKQTEPGFLLGGGWEYAFYNNWSFKVEYNHIWFASDTVSYPSASNSLLLQHFGVRNSMDVVKVGVNYTFPVGGLLGLLTPH